METLDIALDVEGVLADSHAATAERSDFLEPEHCPPNNWDFPSEDHYEEYMHVSQNLWHNHAHHIPPMADDLWKDTRTLSRRHNVDIVTHRSGVDEQVREWLDGYNIHYEDFHVAGRDKTDVGEYDVHIDDSPQVAQDALESGRSVVLIDRPYNEGFQYELAYEPFVWRVNDLSEAAEVLTSSPLGL